MSYDEILSKIKERKAFSFSRWGDGEFNAIFGDKGKNCDGHQYFPDLGARLEKILLCGPKYAIGLQSLVLSERYKNADRLRQMTYLLGLDWVDADIFHNASHKKRIFELLDVIKERYVIIVGPAHLSKIFACVHIVTLPVNCWLNYQQVKNELHFHLDGVNNAVVLFSASMMSNVLIDDFSDSHHTLIDTGSVFDPYCGVFSRGYHFSL